MEVNYRVGSNRPIAKDVWELKLFGDNSRIRRPGQFVDLRIDGCYLRRPISVCAVDGERLRRGLCIIAAGEHHLRLKKDANGYYITSTSGQEKVSGHCPSVDVMFTSVAENAGANAIGAILTGMGRDGADGLLKMKNAGAFTIGQDKESCVVYGMPMEAFKIGAVEVQAPLYNIADIILNQLY